MSIVTLAEPARFMLEVKKSKFLAQANSVETPDSALAWLKEVSDASATHNCWAYQIGSSYRFSDDGEPGGTAGRPILSAIQSQGVDLAIVVVTRWYGGINLGAGGLARAYGGSAAECLRTAHRREIIATIDAEIACDFTYAGAVHALLATYQTTKLAESFSENGLRLQLRVPTAMYGCLAQRLSDLTRGAATLITLDPGTP